MSHRRFLVRWNVGLRRIVRNGATTSRATWCVVGAIAISAGAHPARCQLLPPPVIGATPSIAARETHFPTVSAAEAEYHVDLQEVKLNRAVAFEQAHYPIDSMRAVVADAGARWLARVRMAPVRGMQLDAAGRVGVAAGDDAYAQAQITARLKASPLSFDDSAFTYLTAVRAFANGRTPEQLRIAEEHMRGLDVLGNRAAYWRFQARTALLEAYYLLGRSSDVITHGASAIRILPVMPFSDRSLMFPYGEDVYAATLDALAGQPGGRARIDSLIAILQRSTVPAASLVALDSAYDWKGREYQMILSAWTSIGTKLGTAGAPLVSNYWLNRPASDSATVPVNDGTIRILEFGSYSCPPCLLALYGIQRLQQRFPQIQSVYVTSTLGWWGNRSMEPDEEAQRLKELFLEKMRLTVPISIWKGRKVQNVDGGMTPADEGPNFVHYPQGAKPTIWVLDGSGMIRHVFFGYSREKEEQLARVIQFLLRESVSAGMARGLARPPATAGAL
jgi:hypothetical protein